MLKSDLYWSRFGSWSKSKDLEGAEWDAVRDGCFSLYLIVKMGEVVVGYDVGIGRTFPLVPKVMGLFPSIYKDRSDTHYSSSMYCRLYRDR